MIKIKFDLEKSYLIVMFSVILLIGYANLVDNKLSHESPFGYFASDAFQHQTRAEGIKDAGSYRNEPSYNVFGIDNVIGYYPPVIYHLSAMLSHSTGLEVFDTIQLTVFLSTALSVLIIYFIIKKFNTNVAILSLPLSVLVFYNGLYTSFTFGIWPSLLSQFFLIGFFWYISNIDLKYSFVFFGIFLSAIILTHTSEAIFAALFFGVFLLYKLSVKELNFKLIKNAIFGSILTIIISLHFMIIFRYVWMVREPFTFDVIRQWSAPTIFLLDFGILLILFLIGFVSALFLFRKKNMIPLLISVVMLIFGYTNYIGFSGRAFQLRFFWPIYLSFLFGFGVYQIARIAYKNWKTWHSIILAIIFILILTNVSFALLPGYEKVTAQGVMDEFHWESLIWLSENTPENSSIYFFYGDIYSQDALLRNSKRYHAQVIPEDFIDAINNGELRRFFDTEFPGDGGGGAVQRSSLFSFNFKLEEISSQFKGKKDVCEFDYFVLDKGSRQEVLAQYNILLANELIQNDFIDPAFENQLVVVLKNNNPGADCIEERSI